MNNENPNEKRADRGLAVVDQHSDQEHKVDGTNGMETDISDVMANLFHLADRYGLDKDGLITRAVRCYEGDLEDGPRVNAHLKEEN